MIEEITATFINPPHICKTRKNGKLTNWLEYMVCRNCEETTDHDLLTTEDGFYYRCQVCHFETETISNTTLEIVQEALDYMAANREDKE